MISQFRLPMFGQLLIACLILAWEPNLWSEDLVSTVEVTQTLKAFDYTQARNISNSIERTLLNVVPAQKAAYEQALLAVVTDTSAKPAGRVEAARLDAWVASADSLKALEPFLTNEILSQSVRGVYELVIRQQVGPLHDQAVAELLQAAKENSSAQVKAGLANSLGLSRDPRAVPMLAEWSKSTDPILSLAAVSALGLNGTAESAQILLKLPKDSLNVYDLADALTVCAERLSQSDKVAALSLTQALASSDGGAQQAASWLLQEKLQRHTDPESLTKALQSSTLAVQQAAAAWIARYGADAVPVTLQIFPQLSAEAQTAVLYALAERRDPSSSKLVLACLASKDQNIQIAALSAAGALSLTEAGPQIFELATSADPVLSSAALLAVRNIVSPSLDKRLLQNLDGSDASTAIVALVVLNARNSHEAISHLGNPILYSKPKGVLAAAALIENVATQNDFGLILNWVFTVIPESRRDRVLESLEKVANRLPDKAQALSLLQKDASSSPEANIALLNVTAALKTPAALQAVADDLKSPDVETRKAAIRTLEQFGGAPQAHILLDLAVSDSNPSVKILALRAACNLAGRPRLMRVPEALGILKSAESVASRTEERQLAVASLKSLKGPGVIELAESWLSQADIADAVKALLKSHQK